MRKGPTRIDGSVEGARRVYRDAYKCGRAGKPQPGSRKYRAEAARGWQAGREEFNRNRQLALFAEQAERDAEFNRACDEARDQLLAAGGGLHRRRPGPPAAQLDAEQREEGGA